MVKLHINRIKESRSDKPSCYLCGKELKNPKHTIHVHGGGSYAVTEEEAKTLEPHTGDLGAFYIGSECMKKHPEIKPYVTH